MFEVKTKIQSHVQNLYFRWGSDLVEAWRRNWIGAYSNSKCEGEGAETLRYFGWKKCQLLICELCLAKPEKFTSLNKDIHPHEMFIRKKCTSCCAWSWNGYSPFCTKTNYEDFFYDTSYRWNTCNYDICFQWYNNFGKKSDEDECSEEGSVKDAKEKSDERTKNDSRNNSDDGIN